jgi:hypothetical protein
MASCPTEQAATTSYLKLRVHHLDGKIRDGIYCSSRRSGNDAISITVADRKQAHATAMEWETSGRSGVRIIGDGRIYTAKELARAIIDKE